MTDTAALPAGVHPQDRRASPTDWKGPIPSTPGAPPRSQRQPFSRPNGYAMGTFQRLGEDWNARGLKVGTTPAKVVGRKKGRSFLRLWVPSKAVISGTLVTVTNGVLVAPSAGEASQHAGVVLDVGDHLDIYSEASVYVIALPGKTTGIVQWADFYNPGRNDVGT